MKYKLLGWLLGVMLVFMGLMMFLVSATSAILLILSSSFFLPPIREFFYKKTYIQVSTFVRVVIFFGVLGYSGHLASIGSFNNSPEAILGPIREASTRHDWDKVISLSENYLGTKNPELMRLHGNAVIEREKIEKELEAKAKLEKEKSAMEAEEKRRELAWIDEGKSSVKKRLKDPDSAEFRNVVFNRGAKNIPVACGEVNSKNSFGGYGGFQRFVSAGKPELTFLEEEVAKEFDQVWREFCL